MCRKLKFVRFASKATRSSSSSSVVFPTAPEAHCSVWPPHGVEEHIKATFPPPVLVEERAERRDPLSPLSAEEIAAIQAACGIVGDSGLASAPRAPPAGEHDFWAGEGGPQQG